MAEIIERPGFVPPSTCAQIITDFESLAHLHVEDDDRYRHQLIHYGALPFTGRDADAHGHLIVQDAPAAHLRQWLHGIRATLPRQLGLPVPLYPELSLICRAPEHASMGAHTDYPWRSLTAVIYLNDGFDGGFTRFEDGMEIKPEAGKLIVFKGASVKHEVTAVTGKPRYTASFWWSQDPGRLEA